MRDVEVAEWEVFDWYARRIHEIIKILPTDVNKNIFLRIQAQRPKHIMLPNLRTLRMYPPWGKPGLSPDGKKSLLLPLLSSNLRTVHLLAQPDVMTDYVERLHSVSSDLRHFRIAGKLPPEVLALLGQFQSVEYLDLSFRQPYQPFPCIPYINMLNSIACLKSLETLLLYPPHLLSRQSASLTHSGFQQLRQLAITGTVNSFTTICGMTPYIEHLVLEHRPMSTQGEWLTFFNRLRCCCESLHHLEIHHKSWDSSHVLFLKDHIEPLFALPIWSLALFSEDTPQLHLSDEDLHAVATAWPDLKYLDLFANGRYMYPGIPTLKSVITVTSLCLGIERLRISVWNQEADLPSTQRRLPSDLNDKHPPFLLL